MRATLALLVLLFSMCGAQTRSTETEVQTDSENTGAAAADVSSQLDIYAELKELRDMVQKQENNIVELRVIVRSSQDDVMVLEAENKAVKERLVGSETKVAALERVNEEKEAELVAVKTRLTVSETKVEALERVTAAQQTELKELTALKTRLAATEAEVMNLKKVTEKLENRLAASQTEVKDLTEENTAQGAELTAVKTSLAATESKVKNLEDIAEKSKVAFSAALPNSGNTESGENNLNLVFSDVITNVGQAYSSVSGFFTAPVKGGYYFRFTVMDQLHSRSMAINVCKNGQKLMGLWESDTDGKPSYLSSGLTLQLEEGDEVNMVLLAGYRLYNDGDNNFSTFSGFLLFPL